MSERITLDEAGDLAEDRLALAFAERHRESLHFVASWGKWLRWSGHHWRVDVTRHAFDLVRNACRETAKEKPITAKLVNAVHTFAQADQRLAADHEIWDQNPATFNNRPSEENE